MPLSICGGRNWNSAALSGGESGKARFRRKRSSCPQKTPKNKGGKTMSRRTLWSVSSTLIVLGLTLTLIRPALAGPVLICKSYEIGAAKSLPWGGSDWRTVKPDYDIDRLVDDTLALLTPETPVIARMETLRRAVIYSVWARVDREVNYAKRNDYAAQELFSRLVGNSKQSAFQSASKKPDPLKMFDAGFFVESW